MKNILNSRILILFSILFISVSCGSSRPMIKDVKVQTSYVDSDVHLAVSASLSIGNVSLPQISLPILMPKSWEQIGSVSMSTNINRENLLDIDINLSAVANIEAEYARLPNGSALPLIAQNKVIKIPVGKGVEIYLTIADGVVALGAAIPFKTFDPMGARVGTSSLFPVFNIDNIFGAAGIYTSKEAGNNGFGLFVDLSNLVDPLDFVNIGQGQRAMKSARVAQMQQENPAQLNYSSIKPSSRKEKRINKELLKLHKRRRRLKLH